MNTHIVTDDTCDLPAPILERRHINVIPLYINQGEHSWRDGVDISREEFYRRLPAFHPPPTTATPSPDTFLRVWEKLAEVGAKAILSIHISEKLSATVNEARVAAERFTRVPVTVLDSGQLSLGLGFLVEKAAQMAELGHRVEDILTSLANMMKRTYVFASLKTLEYLRRSGRMRLAMARLGEILQIKPLLHMHQGNPTAHRTRTQSRATERLLEWLREYAPYERLAVVHAGVQAEAEALRERVKDFLPGGEIPVVQITPTLGAHLGVGALGFAVVSKE